MKSEIHSIRLLFHSHHPDLALRMAVSVCLPIIKGDRESQLLYDEKYSVSEVWLQLKIILLSLTQIGEKGYLLSSVDVFIYTYTLWA